MITATRVYVFCLFSTFGFLFTDAPWRVFAWWLSSTILNGTFLAVALYYNLETWEDFNAFFKQRLQRQRVSLPRAQARKGGRP